MQYTWLTLLIISPFLFLASAILLFLHRDHPSIKPRFPLLSFIGIFCHLVLFDNFALMQLEFKIPGSIVFLINCTLIPVWLMCLEGRFIRLLFLYKNSCWYINLLLGNNKPEEKQTPPPSRDPFASDRTSNSLLSNNLQDHLKSVRFSVRTPALSVPSNQRQAWFFRHRSLLTEIAITRSLLFSTVLLCFLNCVVYLCVRYTVDHDKTNDYFYADRTLWPTYYFMSIAGIHVIILALLMCLIWNCKDAYGIRTELIISVILSAAIFSFCLVADHIKYFNKFLGKLAASFVMLHLGMFIASCVTVIWPLAKIYRENLRTQKRREYQSKEQFLRLLRTPILLEEFKEFSVTELSVENVLFHETWVNFCANYPVSFNARRKKRLMTEFQSIYNSFIAPDSLLQLNITNNTYQNIERVRNTGEITLNCLDEVETEVVNLMYHHTYPRFLERRNISNPV